MAVLGGSFCSYVFFADAELKKISCKAKNKLIRLESCGNEIEAKAAQQTRERTAKAEKGLE